MNKYMLLFIVLSTTNVQCANILGIFPLNADSHQRIFQPLLEELALRGHNVDVLSHFPRKSPLQGYTDLSLEGSIPKIRNLNATLKSPFLWSDFNFIFKISGDVMCTAVMNTTIAKELKRSSKKYDVILTQFFFSPCMFGYVEIFKAPVILMTSSVTLPWSSDIIGLPDNPAYIPNLYSSHTNNMNFMQRLNNAVLLIISKVWYHYFAMEMSNKYYKKFFGENTIPLNEVVKKSSLLMVNSHHSIQYPRPLTPDLIEIAGIHIKPNQALSTKFEEHLKTNLNGVIYLSFGTYYNTENFPKDKIDVLLEVLGRLPYKILWKADPAKFPSHYTVPINVEFIPWMPQIPLLCDTNVKLFITHGGMASTVEAVHCGKQALVLPIWVDQMSNANLLVSNGMAKLIPFFEVTKEKLSQEIDDILNNPVYSINAKLASKRFHDRPMSAMDTAVYWTEYIIRHKGAPFLRSKGANLPWYTYYCLDILFILFIVCITFMVILYKLIKKLISLKQKVE